MPQKSLSSLLTNTVKPIWLGCLAEFGSGNSLWGMTGGLFFNVRHV
jgi:hypothetical protein